MQKNLNYKKEASQRQLEKMKKAAAAEKKEEKVEGVEGGKKRDIEFEMHRIKIDHQLLRTSGMRYIIEEPKTEEEKKLFPILDAMGIEHVDVGGRSDA